VLSGGRIRFVIAAGWNDVEYEALGVDFSRRGRIMEEQVALLRQLWTREVVTFRGSFHTGTAAGINPLPVQRPIPLWFGGQSKPVRGEIRDLTPIDGVQARIQHVSPR
jgi:alkanesulfonate monooxygenase SsuD/methylene tetrahydromethanopterin reductase-like flavin-dependent oxidoreductase (luciferase family)